MAMAIGCITSGSPAASVTLKPSGTIMALAASSGERPAIGILVGRRLTGGASGNSGFAAWSLKVVEVQVSPAAAGGVDQANEDLLAEVRLQVDGKRLERFGVVARAWRRSPCRCPGAPVRRACCSIRAAGDAKAGPGLRHLERGRGERALGLVAKGDFESADPVVAGVLALHAAAAGRDGVAFDRLLGEGVARGDPMFERAFLEVEVERFAVEPCAVVGRPAAGRPLPQRRRRWSWERGPTAVRKERRSHAAWRFFLIRGLALSDGATRHYLSRRTRPFGVVWPGAGPGSALKLFLFLTGVARWGFRVCRGVPAFAY